MLTVTVASTDVDLTTTSTLKAALGMTATSEDAKLSSIIRAASRWAENYIGGYPLTVQTYRETRPSYDSRRMLLTNKPVRAVKALFDSTDTGSATQVTSTEFGVDSEMGALVRSIGWEWTVPYQVELEARPRSGQEDEPWLADYVSGYTYGGVEPGSANWSTAAGTTSTGRTLPEDIEQAVVLKAVALYENPESVYSEKLGDIEVSYHGRTAVGEMESYEQLLCHYIRVV